MAIDSADKNRAWATRRWTWDRWRPWASRGVGTGALLGLALLGGAGCSKGGAPDLNGCPKLSDLVPGDSTVPPLRANYVLLKSATGAMLPVTLDGAGGSYAGTHQFTQCDQQDPYTVDKIVLVNKQGDPLATATNGGGGSYMVTYANGQRAYASGANFVDLSSTFTDATMTPAVSLQALTASLTMANQGDAITVQVALMGNTCAIRESQWWLTTASVTTPTITAAQPIVGGSGSVTLRVPPTAAPGLYYLAGQVTLSSGRTLQIRRASASDADAKYTLFDIKGTAYPVTPVVPAVSINVAAKAEVDKTAPQALGITASPLAPVRCGTVNLNLHIKDELPLPAGQQVKVWLGTAAQPKLVSTTVVGSEYLTGSVQLPIDAPPGIWFAWPEVIRDAAGNEARATFNGDGTFTLSGQDAMAKPVAAATFTLGGGLELPDMATPVDFAVPVDLGGQPDMAMPLPAVLTGISVKPGQAKNGDAITIYVTWTDNTKVLQ